MLLSSLDTRMQTAPGLVPGNFPELAISTRAKPIMFRKAERCEGWFLS